MTTFDPFNDRVPTYLRRHVRGWQVCFQHEGRQVTKLFSDSVHGGEAVALNSASR